MPRIRSKQLDNDAYTRLVVDSGATAGGYVFTSLSSALTVANATSGLVTIEMLTDITENNAGALDFSNVRLEGRRKSDGTRPLLNMTGTTTVAKVPHVRMSGIIWDFNSATTALTVDSASVMLIELSDCHLKNSTGTDNIVVTGASSTLTILATNGSYFGDVSGDMISVVTNGTCEVIILDVPYSSANADYAIGDFLFAAGDATGTVRMVGDGGSIELDKNPTFLGTVELHKLGGSVRTIDVTGPTLTLDTVNSSALFLNCDVSGGSLTINLPSANISTDRGDSYIFIKDVTGSAATNNISVSQGSSSGIDGATSLTLNTNYAGLILKPSTTLNEWMIMSQVPSAGGGSHAADHIDGGSDPIDGDKIEITWTGHANYTPTTSPAEVDATDQLTAHLAGIDSALAGAGGPDIDSTVQTTDATTTVIHTVAMPTNDRVTSINATIIGADHTGDNTALYKFSSSFYRNGAGSVSQKGSTTVLDSFEDVAGWDFDLNISGTDVQIRVTGAAATTVEWRVVGSAVTHG